MEIFECEGGTVVLPSLVLVDRRAGGHLIVNPPRAVWERSELTSRELAAWSSLVAAAGRAMIDALPALDGGCINYWEAGNWSVHHDAEPKGDKRAPDARQVHLHLLGRSRFATGWGESPQFPRFAERLEWAAAHEPLRPEECVAVLDRLQPLLLQTYGLLGMRHRRFA